MSKPVKVDLTILKKLVGELEATLATADGIAKTVEPDVAEHIVELSKAAGLCAGIMQEASMLVFDINAVVRSTQSPSAEKSSNMLDSLLSSLKGGSGGSSGGSQN